MAFIPEEPFKGFCLHDIATPDRGFDVPYALEGTRDGFD